MSVDQLDTIAYGNRKDGATEVIARVVHYAAPCTVVLTFSIAHNVAGGVLFKCQFWVCMDLITYLNNLVGHFLLAGKMF